MPYCLKMRTVAGSRYINSLLYFSVISIHQELRVKWILEVTRNQALHHASAEPYTVSCHPLNQGKIPWTSTSNTPAHQLWRVPLLSVVQWVSVCSIMTLRHGQTDLSNNHIIEISFHGSRHLQMVFTPTYMASAWNTNLLLHISWFLLM